MIGEEAEPCTFSKIKESREQLSLGLSFSSCKLRKLDKASITQIVSCSGGGSARRGGCSDKYGSVIPNQQE